MARQIATRTATTGRASPSVSRLPPRGLRTRLDWVKISRQALARKRIRHQRSGGVSTTTRHRARGSASSNKAGATLCRRRITQALTDASAPPQRANRQVASPGPLGLQAGS